MKSSIPRIGRRMRELWFAAGGPWCSCVSACASACALIVLVPPTLRALIGYDVLDGDARVGAEPADEIAPAATRSAHRGTSTRSPRRRARRGSSPSRPCTGSGCAICPCASIPSARSSDKRRAQTPLGVRVRVLAPAGIALRADDQEAGRPLRGALPDRVEQRLGEHGLVRDDEDVRRAGRRGDVRDDVLDRPATGSLSDLVDQVAAKPARTWPRGASRRSARRPAPGRGCPSRPRAGHRSNTPPWAGIPASRSAVSVLSSRRPAAARRVCS